MSILSQLSQALTPLITTVVTGTVLWVGHRVSSWFKHKTGINVDERVNELLDEGIHYAEEAARVYYKKHGQAEVFNKSNAATLYVEKRLKALKLPAFATDLVKQMIDARLGQLRKWAADKDAELEAHFPNS